MKQVGIVALSMLLGVCPIYGGFDASKLLKVAKPRTIVEFSDSLVAMVKQLGQGQTELEKLSGPGQDLLTNRAINRITFLERLAQDASQLITQVQQRASSVDYISYPSLKPRLQDTRTALNSYKSALYTTLVAQAGQLIAGGLKQMQESQTKLASMSTSQALNDATYEKATQPFIQGSMKYNEALKKIETLDALAADYKKSDPSFTGNTDALKAQVNDMYTQFTRTLNQIAPYQQAINQAVERELEEERVRKQKAFDAQHKKKNN